MKRNFQSDDEIPSLAWQLFPEVKEQLDRIIEIENDLESAISNRKRMCFALNSEPEIKTKILRIHIRHTFNPASGREKAHFIITIEGHVLDKSKARQLPLGAFFDKIRIQLDKRFHPTSSLFEWSVESYPEGAKGQCFRAKVYGDKAFATKLFLHRSSDIRSRYELSPLLKDLFPSLQVDPSEEQVLLAFWGYVNHQGLLEGKDKRQIKCNQELKNLFGVEILQLSAVRQKLAEYLTVCKPIQVEYNVTTSSSTLGTRYAYSLVNLYVYNFMFK